MRVRIAVHRAPHDRSHAEQKQHAREADAEPFLAQEIVIGISENFDHICSHSLNCRDQTLMVSAFRPPRFNSHRNIDRET